MATQPDHLAQLRVESARFLDVMRDAPAGVGVPTCPDWSSDDLLWHLGEVQWFWGTIVRDEVTDPESLAHPERPGDRAGLVAFFEKASHTLQQALAHTPPQEARWTWSSEQTAGFIRRRQAHEALIHRVDAELTADAERADMDPALCSDGVDEALRVMFAGVPDWGRFEPEGSARVRVTATDTGHSWLVTLGRFSGTDPEGTAHDEPDIAVADSDSGEDVAAGVGGTAADLDCWLWGRPTTGPLERSGDEDILSRLQEYVGQGID